MSNREDFSAATRYALAQRAGYRCSFPGCTATSIGPSSENDHAVSNTGTACHIVPAASGKGARRKDATFTADQIKDISNGIWMCATHGRLIDNDENTYTAEMLRTWRKLAELSAQIRQATGKDPILGFGALSRVPIPNETKKFEKLTNENEIIGDTIEACALHAIWGTDIADCVKDYCIEYIRNILTHGNASKVTLHVSHSEVTISDDGVSFDPISLQKPSESPRGGHLATSALLRYTKQGLFVTYSSNVGLNKLSIFRAQNFSDIQDHTPCTVLFERKGRTVAPTYTSLESCNVVYIYLPRHTCQSDIISWQHEIQQLNLGDRKLVFIGSGISTSTSNLLSCFFPQSEFVEM